MTNRRFEKLFGGPARKAETAITGKEMDIAASIQKVTEEIMLKMAGYAHKVTGLDSLCLAGGCALNCVGNGRILREGPFKHIWIQPASGDAGAALGAALLAWHKYLRKDRKADAITDRQKASFLGPGFSDEYIEAFLEKEQISFEKISYEDVPTVVSDLILQGNVIGWFQGALEFGPRALGARSIIADARREEMQSKMNLKIKYRESFRPFAPTVLKERACEWFDLDEESPYMLLVAPVKQDKRMPARNSACALKGFDLLKEKRSVIPAVTHVDYSARIQTLKREDAPLYYDVINAFFQKTGCPLIVNTSFNVRGEPLVCSPQDAFNCFMRTEIDYLVMGRFLLDKRAQAPFSQKDEWQKSFELD